MQQTESDLHDSFYQRAAEVLSTQPHAKEVFDALWNNQEYRWAWRYLHEEALQKPGISIPQSFAEINEQFFQAYIA
ncbi:MAG TPA: hypothetical protein VEH27_17775 [Methylomirabilota bacterium]|nr:hypothetical protein [Methylomirabilota bacterium]